MIILHASMMRCFRHASFIAELWIKFSVNILPKSATRALFYYIWGEQYRVIENKAWWLMMNIRLRFSVWCIARALRRKKYMMSVTVPPTAPYLLPIKTIMTTLQVSPPPWRFIFDNMKIPGAYLILSTPIPGWCSMNLPRRGLEIRTTGCNTMMGCQFHYNYYLVGHSRHILSSSPQSPLSPPSHRSYFMLQVSYTRSLSSRCHFWWYRTISNVNNYLFPWVESLPLRHDITICAAIPCHYIRMPIVFYAMTRRHTIWRHASPAICSISLFSRRPDAEFYRFYFPYILLRH